MLLSNAKYERNFRTQDYLLEHDEDEALMQLQAGADESEFTVHPYRELTYLSLEEQEE